MATRKIQVMRVAAALAAAACGVAAAPAAANTLTYSGAVTTSDPTYSPLIINSLESSCGNATSPMNDARTVFYDAYAFRSAPSGASDCVTVRVGTPSSCTGASQSVFSEAYLGNFDPADPTTNFAGGQAGAICNLNDVYSVAVPAGQTLIPLVTSDFVSSAPDAPYTISVTGTNVQAAQEVDVDAHIPKGNHLVVQASSLADGSDPTGTVTDTDENGNTFTGPIRCLRTSGRDASIVMTIDPAQSSTSAAGDVLWLHQGVGGGDLSGQRNGLLTKAQLDRYTTCPDPTAPPHDGVFNPIASGHVSVVNDPPPSS